MGWFRALSGFALIGLAAAHIPSLAQDAVTVEAPVRDERGTFTFVIENDWFGDQDRNYTNGLRLGWLSKTRSLRGVDAAIAGVLARDEAPKLRRGLAIGQSVFTPNDITETQPLPDQHPYAGYLYIEGTSLLETGHTVDQVSLRFGLVGPSAGGEWIQDGFHKLFDEADPRGWDNQIPDEVGTDLTFDRRYRALAMFGSTDLGADIIPNIGATVGTMNTNARAGLTVRFGEDLKNDLGPPRVRPSLAGAGYFDPSDGFSWYIFGGAEARYVAHDIILGGSLFRDDERTVSIRNGVLDLQAGTAVQFRSFQLGLTYVERTKQYEEQTTPQRFGAVSFSWKY